MLPSKPSELINLALNDLEAVEVDSRYRVNMNNWHLPIEEICEVCLAGSVIAKSFNRPSVISVFPQHIGKDRSKLYAINEFRGGNIYLGLSHLGLDRYIDKFKYHVDVSYYEDSPSQFKADMRDMARQFEKAGL